MTSKPVHLFYSTQGNNEYCLRFGADNAARKILIIPPLFDEMNRTRRMIVETMRHLAQSGVQTHLPDLPGCNESSAPLLSQSITDWQQAVADAVKQFRITHTASIRGGCLLDNANALPAWRLAPVNGAALLKILLRTRIAGDKETGLRSDTEQLLARGREIGIHLCGHHLGPQMLSELEMAVPTASDLVTQDALADVAGTALWLRAEPDESVEMSLALATRLEAWSLTCGG